METKENLNKGITLVALVITIIILLILAGVAITALTQTGLFENAKQAKNAMENAQNTENITLVEYSEKINETQFNYQQTFENDKLNKKTKRLNKVIIYLNDTDIKRNYNNTISTLIHELTHAWEDYNRNITNNLTLNDLISQKFGYKENIKQDNSDNFYKTLAKQIEYYLSKFEVNAFLSELSTSLYKNKKKIDNYSDAINIFKSDETWISYITLYKELNGLSEIKLSKFTMFYNDINKTNFTENKLLKKLNNRFEKVFRKVLTNAPKIYYD